MQRRLLASLIPAIVLLLALTVNVIVARGYSELVPCGNGVYLLVRDDGYVTVYAMPGLDKNEVMQIALDCLQTVEYFSLAHRASLIQQSIGSPMQDLKQLEKAIKLIVGASRQTVTQNVYTVQKTSEQKTMSTCVVTTYYTVKHSVSPMVPLLLVILGVLSGYSLSKLVLGRVLGGQ